MLYERTSTTALNRFWTHVDSCVECSPEGACGECKQILQAVTAEAKANASQAAKYCFTRTDAGAAADSLRAASDLDLMQEYEEVCSTPGSNEIRREALLVEITRRARSLRFD